MKYFEPAEFACSCDCGGGFGEMDRDFLAKLDDREGRRVSPFA